LDENDVARAENTKQDQDHTRAEKVTKTARRRGVTAGAKTNMALFSAT